MTIPQQQNKTFGLYTALVTGNTSHITSAQASSLLAAIEQKRKICCHPFIFLDLKYPPLKSLNNNQTTFSSDGTPSDEESKSSSSQSPTYNSLEENKCHNCGKHYKSRNCLKKHLWEHHEAWEITKRFCSSKHEKVQLLEAAQALLTMTASRSH